MSSLILHARDSAGDIEEIYVTPRACARWMKPPKALVAAGQIPQWAECIVVDEQGTALPVLETAEQVGSLYAHAAQNTWFGFRYEGDQIWGSFYNSELHGVEHRFTAQVRTPDAG